MQTMSDVHSAMTGSAIVMSLILAPFAAGLLLPFWTIGKMVEIAIGRR